MDFRVFRPVERLRMNNARTAGSKFRSFTASVGEYKEYMRTFLRAMRSSSWSPPRSKRMMPFLRRNAIWRLLRLVVAGELAAVLERIAARKATLVVHSTRLVVNERGQPLGKHALRYRFTKVRSAIGVELENFQFRDLRAKAATDKEDATGNIRAVQQQLGHASVVMTEHYIRRRRGAKITPTK